MARLIIDTGTAGNTATGDSLRGAFTKTNANFAELYAELGSSGILSDLSFAGNTISTDGTNQNLILDPNGTGKVIVEGTVDLGGLSIASQVITGLTTNANITLSPAGTGDVVIDSVNLTLSSGGLLGEVWGDSNELTLKSPTGGGGVGYVALSSANEENYVEVSNDGIAIATGFDTAGFRELNFDTNGTLTLPGALVATPVSPAAGAYPASATALDLTRQVQILTSSGTQGYTLADGAEGQIMYFVPASGITGNVFIQIANARLTGEGPLESADYDWEPFFRESPAPTTIAMAIFANGAWCLRGGNTKTS